MNKIERKKLSWSRRFLLYTGILEVFIEVSGVTATAFLGLKGFVAGEMGTMIGMFAVAVLILFLPFTIARGCAVYGIYKRKKWAAVLTIVLSALLLVAGGVSTFDVSLLLFFILLFYCGLSGYAALLCLRGA